MSKTVLITGAAGFAGTHLIELLGREAAGLSIVAWHRPGRPPSVHLPRARWEAVDLSDPSAVRESVASMQPDFVYHCAGAAHVGRSWADLASTFHTNVRGTHHLLEGLRAAGCETRVLIPGSAMVYRPADQPHAETDALVPPTPYGMSKLAQELLGLRASTGKVSVTIGRAFNHIGPRQDPAFAASGFARQIAEIEMGLRAAEVVVGNLEAHRDIMDVRDTVRAYRAIAERGRTNRPYNVCTGRAMAIGELLDRLVSLARVKVTVRVDPQRFRPVDQPLLVGNAGRLQQELGWSPTIPLSQTLDDLMAYWRQTLSAT